MALMLTSNACLALNNGNTDLHPVLQIVDIYQTERARITPELFRLVLSDGVNLQRAILATQLNEKVENNLAVKGSIVHLLDYTSFTGYNRIIMVLNMEVVELKAEIIGDPKHLNAGGEQQAAPPNPGPGPGFGGVQQQQPPSRVSAPSSVADAANSGNGFRSSGSGSGQTLGTGMDNGAGGFNMSQVPSGGYNPYASAGVRVIPEPGVPNGAGVGYGQEGQQQNTFGRFTAAYQPAPVYGNRGPFVKKEEPARCIPIAALRPWTIKAQITAKSEVQRFHNAKGEVKVFSFDMRDADDGEIRAKCFHNVVDQFYHQVQVGRVYIMSQFLLKAAQKNYSHLKHDWEIHVQSQTTMELCADEDGGEEVGIENCADGDY